MSGVWGRRFGLTVTLTLSLVALAASHAWVPPILELRTEEGHSYGRPEDLGPENAIVVALGSFRGWFVSYLWVRAEREQSEGNYHESLDSARLICRLMPNFDAVWNFQAWNMAYNISMAAPGAEERWQWVLESIDLLHEGIDTNPYSRTLHRQLSWMYQGRIQGDLDRTHWYNKDQIAFEWQRVLGIPPAERPGLPRVDQLQAWLAPIAAATRDGGFEIAWSEWREEEPKIAAALSEAADAGGVDVALLDRIVDVGGDTPPEWLSTLGPDEWPRLLAFARAQVIVERHRLDPRLMSDLVRHFGPIDWRHPAAHVLYWGAQGPLREKTRELYVRLPQEDGPEVAELYAEIPVRQSLKILMQGGTVVYQPDGQYFLRLPDPRFAPRFRRAILSLVPRLEGSPELTSQIHEMFRTTLEQCVEATWMYGNRENAGAFYDELRQHYPEAAVDGGVYPDEPGGFMAERVVAQVFELELVGPERLDENRQPLSEEALAARLHEERSDLARHFLQTRARAALNEGIATGFFALGERLFAFAEDLRQRFEARGLEVPASRYEMQIEALREFFLAPPALVRPHAKSRLWNLSANSIPLSMRQAVYPEVAEEVRNQFRRAGINADVYFAPPENGDATKGGE